MTDAKINLTQLREKNQGVLKIKPDNFCARITPRQVEALIDTAEAAIALVEYNRNEPDFTNLANTHRLRETLNRYTP